ncbi:polyphosphate kinase 1 [Pedobacter namyangjuensis]|uniref:polyphosphate kinase 1 n=1 Tax=Pedobacter namyangjuensis TaxID=600626 RepID=UPI000DE434C6|nr:polyphosphate kinase 1 [Pedobacter namyangjuensis]
MLSENPILFDRDLSWLSFNERVLNEALADDVPLLEKINFLAIYSSNLDEFYRVRMPVLLALDKLSRKDNNEISIADDLLLNANEAIHEQQETYGKILKEIIIPQLHQNKIDFIYGKPIPKSLAAEVSSYFLSQVLAFLQPVDLSNGNEAFFPENNALYFVINLTQGDVEKTTILNIPSNHLSRFYKITKGDNLVIIFLDDIIKANLNLLFADTKINSCCSFKITRDAEIDLKDEYAGNLAEQLEKQLQKRDFGLATRFLYQPGLPEETLSLIIEKLNLKKANLVAGGNYHNLKDLADFPVKEAKLSNPKWEKISYPKLIVGKTLSEQIHKKDILINTPYQSYDAILRFFNEAATNPKVEEIYVTLYRVASDSKIVNALISAAKNGKKVSVLVELKARFDEANNIKWAKKMKEAGVKISYSVTALKVHAKIALVKSKEGLRTSYVGLLATGNFNETTANFYTDHILMTADSDLLREMELLFIFLAKRVKPSDTDFIQFNHLLVAQFNLQETFLALISREIDNALAGKEASITIKLNNLEEKVLISKLYEASNAGVKVNLIVRGICRLVPAVENQSENITVTRIVDRYLEHGRIFVFHNLGEPKIYLGSADWMNRNIYRRIEVCFPLRDEQIKKQLLAILDLQMQDNVKAVRLDGNLKNEPIVNKNEPIQSQYRICQLLKDEKDEK